MLLICGAVTRETHPPRHMMTQTNWRSDHNTIFKQFASQLPHEANVEQPFSRAGNLSDPNMDVDFLAALTSIAVNKKAYKPTVAEIKDKYFEMYRGKESGKGAGSSTELMDVDEDE